MLYTILGVCLVLLALVLTIVSLKVLMGRRWILAWLRGTASLFAIVISFILLAVAWDFVSYGVISQDKTIATVAVKEVSEREFELTIAIPDGQKENYAIKGDLWQLDVRVINWGGPLEMIGLEPGYRLDRLSGRYISLEADRASERTVYDISGVTTLTDVWTVVSNNAWLPWIEAKYGSATYLPMRDGALYAVSLGDEGLFAKPLNEPAENAVESWH